MKKFIKIIAAVALAASMAIGGTSVYSVPEATVAEAATKKINLYVGDTYKLGAKSITTSNKKVVKVVKSGKTYNIKAVKKGKATITVKNKS